MEQYNIYKTTNLVNGKFYWGVHNSINKDDGYLGSGKVLKNAIKKYGKENFKREVKFFYDTSKEAFEDEKLILTQGYIDLNPLCYNIKRGGCGGFLSVPWNKGKKMKGNINSFKIGHVPWNKGLTKKEDSRIVSGGRKKGSIPWNKGMNLSENHIKNLSESHKGSVGFWINKARSEKTKEKIRIGLIGNQNAKRGK